jgi:geranylgeranyl pyrophosphate synthase
VQRALLLASGGQQRDLLAERRVACELSREECISIASAKAGALLGLACRLGAMCAGVEEARIDQCAEMGRLLGIAAQLDNDAHDLSHLLQPLIEPACSRKSDLARGKKTLPVVLAAHSLRTRHAQDAERIDAAFQQMASLSGEQAEACACALREGILTTWGLALLYRERAGDYLRMLAGDRPVSPALLQVLGFECI